MLVVVLRFAEVSLQADWDVYLAPIVPDYRVMTRREIDSVVDDARLQHGVRYTVPFLEGSTYLPHLLKE